MDGMDSDLVLEVPDTPDRLAIRRPVDGSSEPSWEKEDVGGGVNPSRSNRSSEPKNKTYVRRCRDSSHRHLTGSSATSDDTEFLFRQAQLAQLMSNPIESKFSSHSQSKQLELGQKRVSNGSGKRSETIDLGRKSSFPLTYPTRCRDSRRKIVRDPEGKESGGHTELLGIGSSLTNRSVGRPWCGAGSTLTSSVGMEGKTDNLDGDNVGLKSGDKGKGIDLCSYLQPRNGCISPCSIAKSNIWSEVRCQNVTYSVDGGTFSSSAEISDRDGGKGIDLCRNPQFKTGQPLRPRSTGQRRLVRNGCISPHNIDRGKNVAKAKEDDVGNNGIYSHPIHINSPDSEGRCANKKKGKVIVEDIVVADEQNVRDKSRSGRVCSLPGKEVTIIADMEGGADRFGDKGWRTTHNHIRKPFMFPSCEIAGVSKSQEASGPPSNQSLELAMGNSSLNVVHDDPEVTSLQHGSNLIPVRNSQELDSESRSMKGKRKLSSARSHIGECSSSISEDPVISSLRSSRQPSNSRSTRSRRSQRDGIMLGPVIEVDELRSPEVVCNNPLEQNCRLSDHSIARDWQVDSDEILARQLQEEFYNETPGIGGSEEIDATIAWSLLQEDDVQRASIARQDQSRRRDSSSLSARERVRQSSVRATSRARLPTSSRMAQLRRNFNRPTMDLEMRLNVLEALEVAFGDGNDPARPNHILQVQRDFNENDYEMLLALDENNHQHVGASESQINNLPQSVIQNDNSEEACAVCLETPSIGDTIRHLPCLHKFHKECIDTWLRRRMSCPICKSGIT